jgi:CDP-glycerol glycerophosphotransferase
VYSIGAPRTDKLVESGDRGSDFRKFANVPLQNPIILYAPTWQQDDRGRSLIPFGQDEEEFLGRLSAFCKERNCYLVLRSHQNTSFLERPYDNVLYCPQVEYPDTEDILLETDILISDWSSIVFDYLLLNRPTIFLDVPHPFAKGCTLGPEYRFGHVVPDLHELTEALGEYVDHPDRYWARYGERHRAIKEFTYDSNADGCTSERCLNRLHELFS